MMIDDAGASARSVRDRLPQQSAKLRITHERMGAQCHEIVAGCGLHSDFRLQEFEHQRHGHGARAVGNDDENAFASKGKRRCRLGNDLPDFIAR